LTGDMIHYTVLFDKHSNVIHSCLGLGAGFVSPAIPAYRSAVVTSKAFSKSKLEAIYFVLYNQCCTRITVLDK